MRFDEVGIFWQDYPTKRGSIARPMPPIPETNWVKPTSFPNLSTARSLTIDVETYDPELKKNGPGWARSVGHLVGVAVATDDCHAWYFPMRHTVQKESNMEPEHVLAWLRDTLGDPRQPKLGTNIIYDVGWLLQEGVRVAGDYYDIQYAEALLSEAGFLDLDYLAEKYLNQGKETSLLYKWCADYYGGQPTQKQRENIYRSPPSLVGPYAIGDVLLPTKIIPKQYKQLCDQSLEKLFERENKLIPLLVRMRQEGVRVDVDKAELINKRIKVEIENRKNELRQLAKRDVDIYSSKSLSLLFNALGVPYPMTKPSKNFPNGNPSFTKNFLKNCGHDIAAKIVSLKELDKLNKVFIESYILESNVNGRLYCQFHPLRGEEFGARSGRFSSSNPNLQNIPSRDPELAPLIRSLFVPEDHHVGWRRFDASQIEYRFLAHFAVGHGAEEIRARYNSDPRVDYHKLTQHLIEEKTGVKLARKPTKNINFGLIYGMGESRLSSNLGVSLAKGKQLFEAYHQGVPFARETMNYFIDRAQQFGYVTTIANRRSRFDTFEPINWHDWDNRPPPLPLERALREYGPAIKRAMTHKALNRVLQGSAAELMKEAMLQCFESGIFDIVGYPRITVHDELDFSDPGGLEVQFAEVKYIFEHAIKLKVPVYVDEEQKRNWGEAA